MPYFSQCSQLFEVILRQTPRWGGGLYGCDGMIQNNDIGDNSATYGGGLYDCDAAIQHNNIGDNSGQYGGGLSTCRGTIQNNTIRGNTAVYWGGGLYSCYGTIARNEITGNSAGSNGGGLSHCGVIVNNLIAGNSADVLGGGLHDCLTSVRNNTIIGNSATVSGGGLYSMGDWGRTIQNCIIWGNSAGEGQDQLYSSSAPTYCCIQGWQEGGEGNTYFSPSFVDRDGPDNDIETYEDNDYRLFGGASCIDAGNNAALPTPPGLDLDGNLRVAIGEHSLTVDMGAYEYNSGPVEIQAILRLGDSAVHLTWRSQPNDTYTIWSRPDFLTGTWIEEATVPSHGAETPWIDAAASGHMKFYRVELK